MKPLRILWVKVDAPLPLNSGGRIRSFHTIRELAARHSVSLLGTHLPWEEPDVREAIPSLAAAKSFAHVPTPDWRPLVRRGAGGIGNAARLGRAWLSPTPVELRRWWVPALRREVAEALSSGQIDLCVADFLSAVASIPRPSPVPTVLYEHNVEHLIWKRLACSVTGWRRPVLELEWRKVRRYERWACEDATVTVAVSEADRDRLAGLTSKARVRAAPTGVDAEYFAPAAAPEVESRLAFVGSMDWYPNEDAARWLIGEILPAIRREIPAASLTLVGRDPPPALRSEASRAGVRLTGTVADVRPYLAEAAVVLAPIRIAGGTRLKILEALAMGKALVSTTIGAEGLPLIPGRHFISADGTRAFALEVVKLLRDPARRRALGQAGRELVAGEHSWEAVARIFEGHCREAIELHAPRRSAAWGFPPGGRGGAARSLTASAARRRGPR